MLIAFSEPERFRASNRSIIANQHRFDLILAHDPVLLKNCNNIIKFLYGVTWIDGSPPSIKEFGVSFVCGDKSITRGHKLRHVVWDRRGQITKPHQFWVSHHSKRSGKRLPKKLSAKILLFDQQFHIAVENTRINNYFTEKLIDCFKTKTIPIYWGCPNIGDYFNLDGIICCRNANEIINACNMVTSDEYSDRREAVEENYIKSEPFWAVEHRLGEVINKSL